MNNSDMVQSLDTYFQLMGMKGGVEVYNAARRAGVLKAVAGGASSADAVAVQCGLESRATGLLLDALCAMRLLAKTPDGYRPAPVLAFFTGVYEDLSSRYWDHLWEYLKTGRPMQRLDDPAEGIQHYAAQASALYWMMLPSATAAARMLGLSGGLDILDVGAGSGVWSLTFAQHAAGSRVTAIDWPQVLAVAVQHAQRIGLAERFAAIPGDCHVIDFGAGVYDLAVVGNLAHLETGSRLSALFRRLHAALKPGGRLVVADVFHSQPGGELNAALYELGLALRTEKGRVHGRAALDACLREGGFAAGGAYQPIPVTPCTMGMMVAQKGV